ncbi:Uncharacterized protein PHSC3_000816 [Chlamydiales bacterium STE3]|nr:Uncharacterized protein PHSC3_000816 [Chlamydiales bacterium STE3]
MPYMPSDDNTLGIDLDGDQIYAAFLANQKGKIKLVRLVQHSLTDQNSENVNPLYIDGELENHSREYLLSASLDAHQVLVRRMRLKLTRDKDIEEVFAFQAEPLLPYPAENAILDKIMIEKQDGTTLLTLLSARKDYLQETLDRFDKFQLSPEIISCDPIALAAFADFFAPSETAVFTIHIGHADSFCALVKQGKLLASHASELGMNYLREAYEKDLQKPVSSEDLLSLDLESVSSNELPQLKKAIEKLVQELGWKVIAAAKETKLKEEAQLLVTGIGASFGQIPQKIRDIVGYPLQDLSSNELFDVEPTVLKNYAVAVGLALIAQPKTAVNVNFRKAEFSYPTPWKRFKKPLISYAGLSLLLALTFFLFGESYLQYSRDKLKEKYLSMLAMIQKPYEEFELSYENKHPHEKRTDETLIPIQELSQENLAKRLDFLERELRSIPDTFPLQPNVPRVSDVLAWLSTHPNVICEGEQKECIPLTIENFAYTLVKRPEQNKKNEKYQVKVDLEFSTASPRIAREFHDALIAPNEMIDPKGEVKWSANRGRYRTSFFLKDKTQYPTPLRE